MIILTDDEAALVRGLSPSSTWAALDPVALKDGTFMLPEAVLNDPSHADVLGFLSKLPRGTPTPENVYGPGDVLPKTPGWKDGGAVDEGGSILTDEAGVRVGR